MKWRVRVSQSALKFIERGDDITNADIYRIIEKAVFHFGGQKTNVDIKKLGGKWEGFYRIRKGKIRIIAEFDFDNSVVFIEEIDWRGNVYK